MEHTDVFLVVNSLADHAHEIHASINGIIAVIYASWIVLNSLKTITVAANSLFSL